MHFDPCPCHIVHLQLYPLPALPMWNLNLSAGLDAHQLLAQPNCHTTYLRLVWMPISCWLSPISILHTCNWSGCPSTAGSAQLPYYNLRLVWMPNKCWLSPIAILHTCGWSGCPSTADSAQSPYYIPAAGLDAHQLLTQPNCHATYLRLVWMPINCWLSPIAILHTCGWSRCPSAAITQNAILPYYIPAAGLDAHQRQARPRAASLLPASPAPPPLPPLRTLPAHQQQQHLHRQHREGRHGSSAANRIVTQ